MAAMRETGVQSLGQEDCLEKGMATHSLQYSFLENSMDTGPWQAWRNGGRRQSRKADNFKFLIPSPPVRK